MHNSCFRCQEGVLLASALRVGARTSGAQTRRSKVVVFAGKDVTQRVELLKEHLILGVSPIAIVIGFRTFACEMRQKPEEKPALMILAAEFFHQK